MNRPLSYNTKQYEAILNYIISLGGAHVTAVQIVEHFKKEGMSIGRTTIYRHLDKLTESGKLRKYTTDGISGACYQFISEDIENCDEHIHLKCDDCGELLHLECNRLDDLRQHFSDMHDFQVNVLKTVLYGRCNNCFQKVH